MGGDRVEDDELLFRRVEHRGPGYQLRANREPRISSQAFTDRKMEPSLDRATLCGGPESTQGEQSNGVVRLVARMIREINAVEQRDPKGKVEFTYKFDVVPVPLPQNPAHAEVHAAPAYRSKSGFRRLLEQLAWLAEWEIPPADAREV